MNQLIIEKINLLLEKKDKIIIVIDGMAGSGKSNLANKMRNYYQANIIHMDDFFLPFDKKTKERLEEPGGNIDYERFKTEVVDQLKDNFTYGIYDCNKKIITDKVTIYNSKILIVEGSYSLHPYFNKYYDLAIFLEVSNEEQKKRILNRDGEFLYNRFINEWIPMENKYFNQLNIKNNVDIIINTSYNKV